MVSITFSHKNIYAFKSNLTRSLESFSIKWAKENSSRVVEYIVEKNIVPDVDNSSQTSYVLFRRFSIGYPNLL